ncbi:MmpS family transport accessory protein [Streptomyces sp. NPDC002845]
MGGTTEKSTTALPESRESAAAEAEEPDGAKTDTTPTGRRSHRPDRAGLLAAGAVLAACTGLVLYGVLDTKSTDHNDGQPKQRTPTAAVTYEVTGTGTADITYQGVGEAGKGITVDAADLPWSKTVEVPLGTEPLINITLGEEGGQIRCTLAIHGRHVQSATATGEFGRATCTGSLPRPDANPEGTDER